MLHRSRIAGIGSYLPEKILSNFDLEKLVETNDQWIRERTGIERRHVAATGEYTSDLAAKASLKAIQDAKLEIKDIDAIILATVTGDQVMPSTACTLQNKLGLNGIPALELSAACSGFVYSITVADSFIRMGMYKNILVVGAEIITRYVNYKDRETCILFGDAAGAFIVSRTTPEDKNIIMSSHLHADGAQGELFLLPAGGSKMPFTHEILEKGQHWVQMKGREIFKHAVRTMSLCCAEALEFNKIQPQEVDWLVPHQANLRILDAVADHFKFPREKVVEYLQETGNTSAASIPVAFDFAVQSGKIKRGQLIMLAAFGAGLTSGSCLLRY